MMQSLEPDPVGLKPETFRTKDQQATFGPQDLRKQSWLSLELTPVGLEPDTFGLAHRP
jgi:hypothetical protein